MHVAEAVIRQIILPHGAEAGPHRRQRFNPLKRLLCFQGGWLQGGGTAGEPFSCSVIETGRHMPIAEG
ncbi:hypothetical protein AKG12_17240 [Agrobacterium sp. SUL3]|nr:hypothetical protein AKG12_17240 [Agrobacterium sp. SUL3]